MTQNGQSGSGPPTRQEPEPLWPDRIVHHGVRILVLLGLAAVVTALFPPIDPGGPEQYTEGIVLDEDVIAEVTFSVPKTDEELRSERDDAAAGVPPTFDYRPDAADSMVVRVSRFFDGLEEAAEAGGFQAVDDYLGETQVPADSAQIELILDERNLELLRETLVQATRRFLPQGVVQPTQTEELTTDRVSILDPVTGVSRGEDASAVYGPREFYSAVVAELDSGNLDLAELLRLITIRFAEYSLSFNPVATENQRDAARQSVQTVRDQVFEREAVARANQRLTEEDIRRLNAYQDELVRLGRVERGGVTFLPFLGALLLHVLLFGVYGMMLFFFRREVYDNLRWLLLQSFLMLAYFGVTWFVVSNEAPPELLPIAFVTLAVAVLWDSRMALVVGLVLSALTVSLPGLDSTEVFFVTVMGGAAAAFSVRVVRRRAQTWVFIAIITATYAGVLLAGALLENTGVQELGISVLWAGSNATVSGLIAMGMLPVFEWFTGITTDQTLLEWADPNRELLRRLSLEAPGTYAHTINVANLGEMAANAIGAHGLLVRVGLYYHDIGKMLKPHFFVENQPEGRNPHDKLKPRVSAGIVREHVVEGARLAREANLPEVISDFILEHHGTQKIAFFHSKALEEEDEESVEEADFRYPGPRPRSRETAISMLADSIESATRVLQEPTPERVRKLVDGIVDAKIQDGQLDEAPLTLKEVAQLRETFVKVIAGIHHHRLDYPTTKHLTDSEDDGKGPVAADDEDGADDGDDGDGEGQHRMELEDRDEER